MKSPLTLVTMHIDPKIVSLKALMALQFDDNESQESQDSDSIKEGDEPG